MPRQACICAGVFAAILLRTALASSFELEGTLTTGDASATAEAKNTELRSYVSGNWLIHESANFRLCLSRRGTVSQRTLADAEKLRVELAAKWLGDHSLAAWHPKCDIVLHGAMASYLRAVPGGDQTVGSTLIETDRGTILTRRIDVRADRRGWLAGAVAHELTHVILAELFAGRQIPRWADEGMAVLADPLEKQDRHFGDLEQARSRRSAMRLVELLSLESHPAGNQQAVFYGQSASVVKFLVEAGTPEQFPKFILAATERGYEVALRDTYRIQGLADLERRWLRYLDRRTMANVAYLNLEGR